MNKMIVLQLMYLSDNASMKPEMSWVPSAKADNNQ